MPLILPSSFMPTCLYVNKVNPHSIRNILKKKCIFSNKPKSTVTKHNALLEFVTKDSISSSFELVGDENFIDNDNWRDGEEEEDTVDDLYSPWEGAILYQRNPSITHIEYCTTLERLGLGHLSTQVSKSRASLMGLRVTKSVKDFPNGTPVLISIDVTRKKHNLKLDGIIRTVITLGCNR